MSRSFWKYPYLNKEKKKESTCFIKERLIYSTSSTISMRDTQKRVLIHYGNFSKERVVLEKWVGFKYGEFITPKKKAQYKGKKNKVR